MDPDFMQMVFDGIMSFEDHALDLLDYSKCPALPVSSSTGHTGPQDHAVDLQAQAGTYTTSAVAAPAASNALAASSYVATAGAPFPDLLATLSSIYAGTAVTSGGPDAATSQPVLLAPTAGCSFEYPAVANHAAAAGIRPAAGLGEVHSMMYATSQPAASLAPPPQQQQQQHASALGLPFSSQLLYADAVAFATCTPTTATQQLNSNGKRARSCECSLAEAAALLLSPHYQGGNCMLGFADARHPRQHEVPGQQDGSYELPSHALREWGTEVNPSCGGGGDALLASLIGPEQWETGTGHKLQLQQQPEQQPTELLQQVQHQMGSIFDGALKASLTARESNEWDQLFQLQSNC